MINRLVLIGNGFDLAHEMKTTYSHFINSYWEKTLDSFCKSKELQYVCNEFSVNKFSWSLPITNYEEFRNYTRKNFGNLEVSNSLLFELSRINASSWLDIEMYYYDFLKRYAKEQKFHDIKILNNDFEGVKKLLQAYLTEQMIDKDKVDSFVNNSIETAIREETNFKDISVEGIRKISDKTWEVIKEYIGYNNPIKSKDTSNLTTFENDILDKISLFDFDKNYLTKFLSSYKIQNDLIPLTFLTFNYTDTEKLYQQKHDDVIHIHGELNNKKNPIIFGYGDELDDHYPIIEKLNDNNFLENIKSVDYAKTNNYKRLLNKLENGYFQVYIMGHSCGNTDRTLLNTIFEHENCISIKIFYYQETIEKDYYLDTYKNISRNFNNKAKLRDRVVNKAFSKPLVPLK